MPNDKNNNSNFLYMVIAVVIGMEIFQWIKEHQAEIDSFSWLFWVVAIAYIVGGVILGRWKDRKWENEYRLNTAKENGFESFAEYMEATCDGSVRESWKQAADKEREKRK